MNGKWYASNERNVYDSEFVKVFLYDVELPDKKKIEMHVVQSGMGAAGVLAHDPDKGILMIWRHRLVGDAWGWELPGGRIETGEKPIEAAARETLEETGWRVEKLMPLTTTQPAIGVMDHPFHFFYSNHAKWEGPHPDANEAADISWLPVNKVRELVANHEIKDSFTLTALLWSFAFGPLVAAN